MKYNNNNNNKNNNDNNNNDNNNNNNNDNIDISNNGNDWTTCSLSCIPFNNTDSSGCLWNGGIVMYISAMDDFTSIFTLGHDGSSEKIYSAYH